MKRDLLSDLLLSATLGALLLTAPSFTLEAHGHPIQTATPETTDPCAFHYTKLAPVSSRTAEQRAARLAVFEQADLPRTGIYGYVVMTRKELQHYINTGRLEAIDSPGRDPKKDLDVYPPDELSLFVARHQAGETAALQLLKQLRLPEDEVHMIFANDFFKCDSCIKPEESVQHFARLGVTSTKLQNNISSASREISVILAIDEKAAPNDKQTKSARLLPQGPIDERHIRGVSLPTCKLEGTQIKVDPTRFLDPPRMTNIPIPEVA